MRAMMINGQRHPIAHLTYDPDHGSVVDFVHPVTGVGVYSGEPLAVTRQRYPRVVQVTYAEGVALRDAFLRAKYVRSPEPTNAERWEEALNALPPMKWRSGGGAESFMMSELLADDIARIFCRVGERYWRLAGPLSLTHDDIVRQCLAVE